MQKPTVNGVVPVFGENSGNSLCNVSRRKRALRSLIRRKRLQLYLKLHTMAFVANARPEQSDTHACSLNKGIGCKSRTRKESVAGSAVYAFEIASTRQDSESSCDSKVLFSMRGIPACGENRSLEGLSWPGEKAEAMRWQ